MHNNDIEKKLLRMSDDFDIKVNLKPFSEEHAMLVVSARELEEASALMKSEKICKKYLVVGKVRIIFDAVD
jgi:hypothetical protein